MDITNQNLGLKKLLKQNNVLNYQTTPTTEETKDLPQNQPGFKGLNGLKGLGNYGAAALLLGSAIFGLSSCEKTTMSNNETWNVTVKEDSEKYLQQIIELLQQLIAKDDTYNEQILEAIANLSALIQAGQDQDKAYYETMTALMNIVKELAQNINNNTSENVELTKQGLELLNNILVALQENNDLIKQYGDGIIAYMETIKAAIENGNNSLVAVLELIWADIKDGNTQLIDKIDGLGTIINTNNEELLNKITEIYENSELTAEERNQKILDAINEISTIVKSMEVTISSQTGELKELLQSFLDAYNKGQITSEKMMELMYNALIEGNTLDKLQLEQIHQIYVSIEEGKLTVAEALKQISELLGDINETLQGMSSQLNEIFNGITEINENVKAGNKTNADYLAMIFENSNKQNEYLDKLVTSNDAQAQLLAKLDTRFEEAITVLYKISENTGKINYEELIKVLNENNAEVVETIKTSMEELGITIDTNTDDAVSAIIEELESFKTLISDNKVAMDTIINILSSIDLNTSLSNIEMKELQALVKELQATINDNNATQEEINIKLDQIKDYLASIDSTLTEISGKLSEVLGKFNTIIDQNDQAQTTYISYLEQLIKNSNQQNTYLQEMIKVQNETKENTAQLIEQGTQIIELLKSADDKLGDLNYANLIAELEKLDAKLAAQMKEMIEKLGITINDNTNNAADKIIAELESFKQYIAGSDEAMTNIINLLNSINLNTALSNTQMEELLKLVEDLKTTADKDSVTQEEINTKLDQIKDYLASIDSTLTEISGKLSEVLDKFNTIIDQNDQAQTTYISYLKQLIQNSNQQNAYLQEMIKVQNETKENTAQLIEQGTQIIELLKSADDKLGDLNYANLIAELEKLDEKLAAQLKEMIENLGITINNNTNNAADKIIAELESFKQYINDNQETMDTIINLLSSIDLNTSLSNSQMDKLLKLVEELTSIANNDSATQEEINVKLDEIKDFLASIDGKLTEILNKIQQGLDKFDQFHAEYTANSDKFFDALEALSNKVGDISNELTNIKENGDMMLNKLDNLQASINEVISNLEQIEQNQGDDLTYAELQELLKNQSEENLTKLQAMLDALGIDAANYMDQKISVILDAIKAGAVDLTTTNNLLQTLINLVSSIGNSMPDGSELNALLEELINSYNSGNANLNDKLEETNEKLEALYQKVCDMYNEVVNLSNNFKTYMALYETNSASILGKLDEIMGDLENAGSLLSSLNAAMAVNNNYLKTTIEKADAVIAQLEELLAKNSDGLTKEQLEEVLKDAGTSLETLLTNLKIDIVDSGVQNTADIINAIKNNTLDLTTTNNLLQSLSGQTGALVDLVKNLNDPEIVIDTSNIEKLLTDLQEAMKNGNNSIQDTNSQLTNINQQIQDLIEAIKNQDQTTP